MLSLKHHCIYSPDWYKLALMYSQQESGISYGMNVITRQDGFQLFAGLFRIDAALAPPPNCFSYICPFEMLLMMTSSLREMRRLSINCPLVLHEGKGQGGDRDPGGCLQSPLTIVKTIIQSVFAPLKTRD